MPEAMEHSPTDPFDDLRADTDYNCNIDAFLASLNLFFGAMSNPEN
jgi:hypothetical protein